jgi:hypothetical protein
MTAWSLRAANEAEHVRLTRRVRIVTSVLLGVALTAAVVAAVVFDTAGSPALGVIALTVLPLCAAVASRRHRDAVSHPLAASVLVGTWMAAEGLVDAEGRLVEEIPDAPDEAAQRQRSIALVAYASARERSLAGRHDWLSPMVHAVHRLDTHEARTALLERASLGLPLWAWIVVGPLAVVGGMLLVLSLMAMAANVLKW